MVLVVEGVVGLLVGIEVESVLDFEGEKEWVGIKVVKGGGGEFEGVVEWLGGDGGWGGWGDKCECLGGE